MSRKSIVLSVLLIGIVPGCVAKSEYQARVRELDALRGQLTTEQQARARAEAQLRALQQQDAELRQRVAALTGDISKAETAKTTLTEDLKMMRKTLEDLKRAQAVAEKRAQAFRSLVARFKAMVDAGKLAVEIRNGLMLVKLPDNILFDPGKTDIKKDGQAAIAEVTKILSDVEGRKFQVAGHTDNQPTGRGSRFRSNWDLSAARALTVVNLMIKDGMEPRRLSAAGYADVLPVAGNDTEDGRRQNRRIEIVLVPNIEDLPPMDDHKRAS